MSQSATFTGAGKATFEDFTFTKWIDKSTPKLMEACATGVVIPSAELVVRKPSGDGFGLEYIRILLLNVIVGSVSSGGSSGEDRATEVISVRFSAFRFTYTPVNPDGSIGTPVVFGWNISENTKF